MSSGCSPTLLSFTGPAEVAPGQDFELVFSAAGGGGSNCRGAGVILQLPANVTLLGHEGLEDLGTSMRGFTVAPSTGVLGFPIVPEAGTQQLTFLRSPTNALTAHYRVWFRAPATTGPLSFKVVLLRELIVGGYWAPGNWEIFEPAGVTGFAQVSGANEVVVNVGATPEAARWSRKGYAGPLPLTGITYPFQGVSSHDFDGDGRAEFRRGQAASIDASGNLLPTNPNSVARLGGQHAVGDVNGDGFDDVCGFGTLSLGSATGALSALIGPGAGSIGCAIGDIDSDGFAEVVTAAQGLAVHRWDTASQSLQTTGVGLPSSGSGRFLLLQDLDDDGDLDILWTRTGSPGIWLGDGGSSWVASPGNPLGSRDYWASQAADFDADGITDLVLSGYEGGIGSGLHFYRGLPGGGWIEDTQAGLPTSAPYMDLQLADMDQDGFVDIVAGRAIDGALTGGIEVWRNLGGSFAAAPSSWASGLPETAIGGPSGIALADANNDGLLDLAYCTVESGLRVYLQEPRSYALESMAGNVVGPQPGGPPADLLELNGSFGGANRQVDVALGTPLRIDLLQPPTNPTPADHFLFGTFGRPNIATVTATPWGDFAFTPQPLAPQLPGLFVFASSAAPSLGLVPMGPTPSTFLIPAGPSFPLTLTFQALIIQSSSASNATAISNGVIANIN